MARVKVGLANLKDIDGGLIMAEFDEELKRVTRDCLQRPHEKKARKVQLTVYVTPDPGGSAVMDSAWMEFEVVSKTPSLKGKSYQVGVQGNGLLVCNPASPDSIDQGTLDDLKK